MMIRTASLVATLVVAAGCNGPAELPPEIEAQPTVDVRPVSQELSFARSGPTHRDIDRLSTSLSAFVGGRTDALHVALPPGSALESLVSELILMGVAPRKISRDPGLPAGMLRATRYIASVPPCRRLDLTGAAFGENRGMPGLGCSFTADLAAQAADPADLLGSTAVQAADPERASIPVSHWRSGIVDTPTSSGSGSPSGSSTSGSSSGTSATSPSSSSSSSSH